MTLFDFAASLPASSRQAHPGPRCSQPEKPNDIKSLIDLNILKVV
jgi:hypothetical protein